MIAKAVKGTGFKGAVSYDLDPEKGALLDTNMAGETPRELAAEFGAIRDLRPGLTKAVLHVSLSAAPGEQLSDEQWREIGQQFREGMGLDQNQYVLTRHTDTAHDHIHLVANRIDCEGQVVSDSHDYQRMHTLMREIERDYGLQEVTSQPAERHAPTKGELERTLRTGEVSTRQQLQVLCDGAAQDCPSFTAYQERLAAVGVEIIPTVQRDGATLSGLQYRLDGVTMKGSDLGKAYAAAGIQKRGISYEQDRDSAAVERCRDRAAARRDRESDRERAAGQGPERGGVGRDLGAASPSDGGLSGGDAGDLSRDHPLGAGRGRGVAGHDAAGTGRDAAGAGRELGGAPGGADAPAALRPGGADRGEYSSARERLLALAGPAGDQEPAGPEGDGRVPATGPDRSLTALRRQTEALGVAGFALAIQGGGQTLQRAWTSAELEKGVGWLKRMNARGHDIAIRPAGEHGLVLVAGLTGDGVARMAAAGWTSAATIETSPGRYEAWVKLSEEPVRPVVLQAAAVYLSKSYGGDPPRDAGQASGRLAGFTNQEPAVSHAGRPPYVLAQDCPGTVAPAAAAVLARIEQQRREQEQEQKRAKAQERAAKRGRERDEGPER